VLAAALCCVSGGAAAEDVLLDRAATLLSRRDPAAAYLLLESAESARAGDPAFDYLLGIAALDSGHVTRAVFALERAVDARPGDRLARAELGRAYLAAGDSGRAREQLRLARAGEAPAEVSAAIDRVLGVIDQVVPSSGPRHSAYLEFGVGYDSNVNSATHQGEFAIPAFGGILFQTAPESRRRHDLVANAAGGASTELTLSPAWTLVGAANLRTAVNKDVHDMDTELVDVTVGVRHASGTQSQTIALQSGLAWVGSSRYRDANGVTAQWQSQLSETTQASVFGQWSRQDFRHQHERGNDRSVLGVGMARSLARGSTLIYGSLYVARERTDPAFDYLGHHAGGLRLGVQRELGPRLSLFGEIQHERRRYGGTEPFFDAGRRDRQSDVTAGLRYQADERWIITGQARHTRAAANVVLYDYTRTTAQVTLRRNFQ
jgi:tetratricopeptide (TPR) repeat protein